MEGVPNFETLQSQGKEIYKDDPQAGSSGEFNSLDIASNKAFDKHKDIVDTVETGHRIKENNEQEIYETLSLLAQEANKLNDDILKEKDTTKIASIAEAIKAKEKEISDYIDNQSSDINYRKIFGIKDEA